MCQVAWLFDFALCCLKFIYIFFAHLPRDGTLERNKYFFNMFVTVMAMVLMARSHFGSMKNTMWLFLNE